MSRAWRGPQWLAARQAELLAVPYFHVVFTLPAPIAAIAFQNKAVVYAILFAASRRSDDDARRQPAEARRTDRRRRCSAHVGADADASSTRALRRAGRRVSSPDGTRWVAGRPNFFLAVKPLAKLFRRLFIERLQKAFDAGSPEVLPATSYTSLNPRASMPSPPICAAPLGSSTPRSLSVGPPKYSPISGATPIASPSPTVASTPAMAIMSPFAWKDYRDGGAVKTICLKPDEFIRRFLLHALPDDGFHRIRHFGFLANGHRTQKLALCRSLLTDGGEPTTRGKIGSPISAPSETVDFDPPPCPECGGVMRVIADLPRGCQWSRSKRPPFWCDTS